MKNINQLINIAENLDWNVTQVEENGFEFQKYSPEGQDFNMYIEGETVEDLVEEIYAYYESYDVSEETSLWIDETGHGKNGAPYHIEDLLNDMKACKEMILELYEVAKDIQ